MNPIEIRGLAKAYGNTQALRGIDLTVSQGEIYGFIGMNGAGKSTTIRILLGLIRKDGGEAALWGKDPYADCVSLHKRIAYVPGDVNPWPNLSGGEVIDLMARLSGRPDAPRRAELIDRFQFDPSKKCRSYSKGNRQKVGLIAALASDAELYILDEPTSGLDPLMESVFQDCVRELAAQGKTVFLSSHILAEVEKLCGRVAIIKDGAIVESGSIGELRQFSRLIVRAQCESIPEGIAIAGAHGLIVEKNTLSFGVDPICLNEALQKLTQCGVTSLHCAPPELEDVFLHYYKGGESR